MNAISDRTVFKLTWENIVSLVVIVAAIVIQYFSLTYKIDRLQDNVNKQQIAIEQLQVSSQKLNEVQLLNEIASQYKSQDRWSGEMQRYYHSRLLKVLQELHPDKNISALMEQCDPYNIQQKYPVGRDTSSNATKQP